MNIGELDNLINRLPRNANVVVKLQDGRKCQICEAGAQLKARGLGMDPSGEVVLLINDAPPASADAVGRDEQ